MNAFVEGGASVPATWHDKRERALKGRFGIRAARDTEVVRCWLYSRFAPRFRNRRGDPHGSLMHRFVGRSIDNR
jgi:hypothetical protein